MPVSTVTISVKMKKRFWLMPVMKMVQLAAWLGIFKGNHVESVARLLAYKGVKVIAERRPS